MSKVELTPKERVLRAIEHQETDRVPTALWGGPYGLVDDLYYRMVDHLGLGGRTEPFRKGHTISYLDDRVLDKLGTDIRYCWSSLMPNSPVIPGEDDGTYYDSYGQVWKKAYPYFYAGEGILRSAKTLEDIFSKVKWPDTSSEKWTATISGRARMLHEENKYAIAMRMVASHGPFQTACDLRGTDLFLLDMAINPEFAKVLLDQITNVIEGLLIGAMQAGGKYFDLIELPGDDYASNSNTLISPKMFQEFIKPCLERLVKVVKEYNPTVKVMLHSDGAITKLIPEFIEIGIDVIHPLEPLPATDFNAVKKDFGSDVTFLGGIDIAHVMPGSKEEVIAEVNERISQLAPGGGYILAPSNHLQSDVPAENVVSLFEAARKYGAYPINKSRCA